MPTEYRNYLEIESLSQREFEARKLHLDDITGTRSKEEDLRKIEDYLELQPGILSGQRFYVNKMECECGHLFTFSDIVKSALDQSHHSASFIAHTLLGRKYIINPPREVRCSACGSAKTLSCTYDSGYYGCCWNVNG